MCTSCADQTTASEFIEIRNHYYIYALSVEPDTYIGDYDISITMEISTARITEKKEVSFSIEYRDECVTEIMTLNADLYIFYVESTANW